MLSLTTPVLFLRGCIAAVAAVEDLERHLMPFEEIHENRQIAVRGVHEREHERHQPFTALDMSTIIEDCQAVCVTIGEILSGQFLVRKFLAKSGHVTQSTRPDQRAAAFCGLVVLLSEGTHFVVRIPLFNKLGRKRR